MANLVPEHSKSFNKGKVLTALELAKRLTPSDNSFHTAFRTLKDMLSALPDDKQAEALGTLGNMEEAFSGLKTTTLAGIQALSGQKDLIKPVVADLPSDKDTKIEILSGEVQTHWLSDNLRIRSIPEAIGVYEKMLEDPAYTDKKQVRKAIFQLGFLQDHLHNPEFACFKKIDDDRRQKTPGK